MTQIMIEVGAMQLQPVKEAIESALADVGHTVEVLPASATADLEYSRVEGDLETVYRELASGKLSSLRFRSDGADVAWALLFGPAFGPDRARPWTGVVELRHYQWQTLFDRISSQADVDFVVVSLEETLDLAPAAISPRTFPWNDPRLIKAAVPAEPESQRRWVVRLGPANEGGSRGDAQ